MTRQLNNVRRMIDRTLTTVRQRSGRGCIKFRAMFRCKGRAVETDNNSTADSLVSYNRDTTVNGSRGLTVLYRRAIINFPYLGTGLLARQ